MPVELVLNDKDYQIVDELDRYSITEKYRVTGQPGLLGTQEHYFLCLNAPGVPRPGDLHPNTSASRVVHRRCVPIDDDAAFVFVDYKIPDIHETTPYFQSQMTVGNTLQGAETNIDYNGDVIEVTYQGDTQPCTVSKQIPNPTFRFSRMENTGVAQIQNLANNYVGTLNENAVFGEPWPQAWLCVAIVGNSQDSGFTWKVDYDFQRVGLQPVPNPPHGPGGQTSGANAICFYEDENGRIPEDVSIANGGIFIAQLYPLARFEDIGI